MTNTAIGMAKMFTGASPARHSRAPGCGVWGCASVTTLTYLCVRLVIIATVLFGGWAKAGVLYEQTGIGQPYSVTEPVVHNYGRYVSLPFWSGNGPFFPGVGGVKLSADIRVVRLKRLSGISCEQRIRLLLAANDGSDIAQPDGGGVAVGDLYCDYPVTGATEGRNFWTLIICLNDGCNNTTGSLVLDGSLNNPGYTADGYYGNAIRGGWAFQLCDAQGCTDFAQNVQPVFDLALLDFGGQALGISSGSRSVTLTNAGASAINLGSISLAGDSIGDFLVDRTTCARVSLSPGSACTISLRFTPKDLGPRSAQLKLESPNSSRTIVLPLQGVGTTAPATPMPRVSTATPSSGSPDTIVTLTGVNFGSASIGGIVKFTTPTSSRVASIVSWTDRTVKVRAPNLSGPAQITLSTAGGTTVGRAFTIESNGSCPLVIRTDHLPAVKSKRQDFTRGFILRTPSTIPLEHALSTWAGTEVMSWNSSGAADTCFVAALDAMRQAQAASFVRLGLRQLTNAFVNSSLGLIPAANPFEEFVGRFVKATITSAILDKSLLDGYVYAFTEEAAGLIISKEVHGHLVQGAASSLVSLGLDTVSSFLKDQGTLEWTWAGDNSSSAYVKVGLGIASINSASLYDPWNGHTTTLIAASCAPAGGGTAVKKKCLVYFENEKTVKNTFDYANVKPGTVVWKELSPKPTTCRR